MRPYLKRTRSVLASGPASAGRWAQASLSTDVQVGPKRTSPPRTLNRKSGFGFKDVDVGVEMAIAVSLPDQDRSPFCVPQADPVFTPQPRQDQVEKPVPQPQGGPDDERPPDVHPLIVQSFNPDEPLELPALHSQGDEQEHHPSLEPAFVNAGHTITSHEERHAQ